MSLLHFLLLLFILASGFYVSPTPPTPGYLHMPHKARPPLPSPPVSPSQEPRRIYTVGIGFGPRIGSPRTVSRRLSNDLLHTLDDRPIVTPTESSAGAADERFVITPDSASSASLSSGEEAEMSTLSKPVIRPLIVPDPRPVFDTFDDDDDEPTSASIEENFNAIFKLRSFFSIKQSRIYIGDLFPPERHEYDRRVGSTEIVGSRLVQECNALNKHLCGMPKSVQLSYPHHPRQLLFPLLRIVQQLPKHQPYMSIQKPLETLLNALLSPEHSANHKRGFLLTATVELRNAYRMLKAEQELALSLAFPVKPIEKILSIAHSFEVAREVMLTAYAVILTELFASGYGITDIDILFFLPMFYLVVASVALAIPHERDVTKEERAIIERSFSPLRYPYSFQPMRTRCLMGTRIKFSIPARSIQ